MPWKECVICGDGFEGYGPAKFCSNKCRTELYPKNERPNCVGCIVCGSSFSQKTIRHITCSKECSNINHNNKSLVRHKKNKPPKVIDCVICGEPFTRGGNHKACSEDCRKEMKRIARRAENKTDAGKARKLAQNNRWRLNNPRVDVRHHLKRQLGFTPPDDLVEEATALRLLNRALKP